MAYLERIYAKGRYYLYLKEYAVRKHYVNTNVIIYRFGRLENALMDMKKWRKDFDLFPEKLKKQGFNNEDLEKWINTLKTRYIRKEIVNN